MKFWCGGVDLLLGWPPFEQLGGTSFVVAGWLIRKIRGVGRGKGVGLGVLGLLDVGARCLSRCLIH